MSIPTEGKDSETLARDLDVTRGEISHTLDELQAKLSPGAVLDRTVGTVRESTQRAADHVSRSVTRNPWPLLAAGVGFIWMIVAGSIELSSTRIGRSARGRRWAASAGLLRPKRLPRSIARESAMHALWIGGGRRRSGAPTPRVSALDNRPLLTGALAVALVVALGYALPIVGSETRPSDEAD